MSFLEIAALSLFCTLTLAEIVVVFIVCMKRAFRVKPD